MASRPSGSSVLSGARPGAACCLLALTSLVACTLDIGTPNCVRHVHYQMTWAARASRGACLLRQYAFRSFCSLHALTDACSSRQLASNDGHMHHSNPMCVNSPQCFAIRWRELDAPCTTEPGSPTCAEPAEPAPAAPSHSCTAAARSTLFECGAEMRLCAANFEACTRLNVPSPRFR